MTEYTWTMEELQGLCLSGLELSYQTDGADTLSLELRPENYAELPLAVGDRLTVTDGGQVVFSGLVPVGANCEEQAASGESVDITLQSDYYVLEHTAFARINEAQQVMFIRNMTGTRTSALATVCSTLSGWLDGYLPSALSCEVDTVVPTPQCNGTAPCASLLADALNWVPDAVTVQRYGSTGNSLVVTTPAQLGEPLVLSPTTHAMQQVAVRPRYDLQVPVCALVGGVHRVWPSGADVRALGAFVYAVPVPATGDDEVQRGGAGGSAASSKMIVRGVRLPDAVLYERSRAEFQMDTVAEGYTAQFIRAMFPEYAAFIGHGLKCGTCIVQTVPAANLLDNDDSDADEDAQVPANYSDDPTGWSADGKGVYVHTEGSFAASTRARKNLRGLRWCKASMSLVMAVVIKDTPAELREDADKLFPGRRKSNGTWYAYVRKTLACNLINKRKKVYDPATNKLCSTDADYNADVDTPEDDNPTAADYIAAMERYYNAASQLQHEGSVSLLHDGSLNPAELTGRLVRVAGMRGEWETMNAVVRAVRWNYQERKLELELGTRSVLGFDEYLERRVIARNRGRDEAQRMAVAYDTLDEDAQREDESAMSVSPSISADTDTESDGRWHKPFTLYPRRNDDDTVVVVLAGGTLKHGAAEFVIDDTEQQITQGAQNGTAWTLGKKVRLKWVKKTDGSLTFNIYQA